MYVFKPFERIIILLNYETFCENRSSITQIIVVHLAGMYLRTTGRLPHLIVIDRNALFNVPPPNMMGERGDGRNTTNSVV